MCLLGRVLYKVKEVPVCNYIFFSSSNFLLRILNKCEKRGKSRQKNLKSNQNSCRSNRQDRWGWARPSIRHILFLVWRGIVLPIKSGKREKKNRVFIIIIFLWIFLILNELNGNDSEKKHKRHTILTFLYTFCSFTMANRMIISMYTLQQQQHKNTLQQSYIVLSKSQRETRRAKEYSPRVAQGQSRTSSSTIPSHLFAFHSARLYPSPWTKSALHPTISYLFILFVAVFFVSLQCIAPYILLYRQSLLIREAVFLPFRKKIKREISMKKCRSYCNSSQFYSHYLILDYIMALVGRSFWFRNDHVIYCVTGNIFYYFFFCFLVVRGKKRRKTIVEGYRKKTRQ